MIRLSKKGWNNVLIFSMLLMIMIFNGMHKKFNVGKVENAQVALLPENSLVLTLKFADIAVERIGQGWRTNPAVDLTNAQLVELMGHWKNQQVALQMDDSEAKVMTQGKMPAYFIIAMLAGKLDGAVYAFYPQLEEVWIHDQHLQRWLKAPIAILSTLIPDPLSTLIPDPLSTLIPDPLKAP
jgi:hypothetical protein